ncbi:DUF4399 domain-containing protein [Roseateles asaccharophilus]|uniref:DUF4399 domain-containing protein n=1 Tax=Roseateles asaccharophilus TaxID=582607 RepID=A0ABU2AFU8_9BURK|nr:DUF4399 domain-containing protein [Roseateles asaccharophilus]MDR7335950.1 hypothetical protein [Roseateles asaccharophilus]
MKKSLACLALLCGWAQAEPLPNDPLERQCWLAHTSQRTAVDVREPVSVHFSNLRTGYRVRAPFWVEFGIRGMGVIPAGNANDKAGHHHILIDTPLPRDHTAPIPFSNTHKHFGKGQTATVLDLPPGRHTLRLLFADHAHKPYFVFSNEIVIEVTGKRSDPGPQVVAGNAASCAAWYQDLRAAPRTASGREVYVKNLRDEELVASPFTLSLGVLGDGLGVAPAGTSIKDTGHFRLVVTQRGGSTVKRQDLVDGRTEAILDLPIGDYEVQAALHDGAGNLMVKGTPLKFSVNRQDR